MKIAISSTGPLLDDAVERRFGRCPYFLIVDPVTLEFEAIANTSAALGSGAGIQSAQHVAGTGVSAVLTGDCGPKAFQVFEQAGIRVVTGVSGSVSDAVQQFTAGLPNPATSAQHPPRLPENGGRGMGGDRGMGGGGRCMGGGGRGLGGGGRCKGGGGRGMGGGGRLGTP